ncbi:uncharacterized protein LOC120507571 [Passer montanus]|uniref:uncharacterized protein LOC120507571 n=1 Tax=Passer montanus TaxID=9160 RepID=UPI0019610628|nr:uncharacterized protein LOC120507571 [Passer montanus]
MFPTPPMSPGPHSVHLLPPLQLGPLRLRASTSFLLYNWARSGCVVATGQLLVATTMSLSPHCPHSVRLLPALQLGPLRLRASTSFLLYNWDRSGCVVAVGKWLSLARCSPSSPSQRFQWLPGGLLRHAATGGCAEAAAEREQQRLQRWGCGRGALLALAGTALHFNVGHERHERVVLWAGTGNWSRWLAHGSRRDLCSRAYFLPCPRGWVFFRNSCYFFSDFAASWENSRTFCWALGSQLLEVDDAEEKLVAPGRAQRGHPGELRGRGARRALGRLSLREVPALGLRGIPLTPNPRNSPQNPRNSPQNPGNLVKNKNKCVCELGLNWD